MEEVNLNNNIYEVQKNLKSVTHKTATKMLGIKECFAARGIKIWSTDKKKEGEKKRKGTSNNSKKKKGREINRQHWY
jgi:hypothetical protein